MIIPDTNLLIYAYDSHSSHHAQAKDWWESVLSGKEPVGIPWIVVLAFTRLITHPKICSNPLSIQQVHDITSVWLRCPHVRVLSTSATSLPLFFDLLLEAGTGGNLSTDAMIAMHAIEHSAVLYTHDRDFTQFSRVKWVNPLSGGRK